MSDDAGMKQRLIKRRPSNFTANLHLSEDRYAMVAKLPHITFKSAMSEERTKWQRESINVNVRKVHVKTLYGICHRRLKRAVNGYS